MSCIFIEYKCDACNGRGCDLCEGTGSVGGAIPSPKIPIHEPNLWADSVRHFRERNGISIRAMGKKFGLNPSQWSRLERGLKTPTDEQRAFIDTLMHT